MKKVIIASVALFFAAISNVSASTNDASIEIIASSIEDTTEKRTPVKLEELPAPVQQAIAGEDYKGWTASSAFLVTKGDKEYYEVKLTKEGSEANKVKLDKNGKKVD
jgi:hypothetical protein